MSWHLHRPGAASNRHHVAIRASAAYDGTPLRASECVMSHRLDDDPCLAAHATRQTQQDVSIDASGVPPAA